MPCAAVSRYVLLVVDDHQCLPARLASATPGAEMVTCSSPEAAACALGTGRRYSALVTCEVGPELADLADLAACTGTPVLSFARETPPAEMATALAAVAAPVRHVDRPLGWGPDGRPEWSPDCRPAQGRGHLVAVCGPGGTGTSTIAAALAVAFAGVPWGSAPPAGWWAPRAGVLLP